MGERTWCKACEDYTLTDVETSQVAGLDDETTCKDCGIHKCQTCCGNT